MAAIEIVEHRGAMDEAPENTTTGFRRAKSIGLTVVELDVRVSRHNKLAVIHGSSVDRSRDATDAVSDYRATELAPLGALRLSETLYIITPAHLQGIARGVIDEDGNRSLEGESNRPRAGYCVDVPTWRSGHRRSAGVLVDRSPSVPLDVGGARS